MSMLTLQNWYQILRNELDKVSRGEDNELLFAVREFTKLYPPNTETLHFESDGEVAFVWRGVSDKKHGIQIYTLLTLINVAHRLGYTVYQHFKGRRVTHLPKSDNDQRYFDSIVPF